MNTLVQLVLWTVIAAIVSGLVIVIIACRNARDGFEDEEGFHSGAPQKKEERDVALEIYHIG